MLILKLTLEESFNKLAEYGDFTLMYLNEENPKYSKGWICEIGYFIIQPDMIKETLEQAIEQTLNVVLNPQLNEIE